LVSSQLEYEPRKLFNPPEEPEHFILLQTRLMACIVNHPITIVLKYFCDTFKRRLVWVYTILISVSVNAQSLSGSITDGATGEKLPGAIIYLPDLKKGTTSDRNGNFELNNLPKGIFLVQVKLIGYTSLLKQVDLNSTIHADFSLEARGIEEREVVITGSAFTSDKTRTSIPVSSLDRAQLQQSGSSNLMEAIAQTPGVSTLSTGAGIAKPVIRGLGLSRVLVIDKGIRQEGQQWGEEHGPEIDQYSADHIEILKGPASLQYGSDALGGVIHILEPILPASGVIETSLHSVYSTNNKLTGNSLMAAGNLNGTIFKLRGSKKSAASFSTPVEKVYNTCFNENAGELMLGMNKGWGFSHWNISQWNSNLGLTEGERDGSTGQFLDQTGMVVTENQLNSRQPELPFQRVSHFKLSTTNNFIFSGNQLRITAGYQKNIRQEFEDGVSIPEKDMKLNTFSGDMVFQKNLARGWEAATGFSGIFQENRNSGLSFIVPDFKVMGVGLFSSVKKNLENSTFNAGLRIDAKQLTWNTLLVNGDTLFTGHRRTFSALTGAVGYTHTFQRNWSMKMNLGRGFRNPTAPELTSNGIHEGTFRYEIGNPSLKSETSLQLDAGLSYEYELISVTMATFVNRIDNYIFYSQQDGETKMVEQYSYPVFRYKQGNALLYGGELQVDFHPSEPIHLENSIAIVIGENITGKTPLPFMPPIKTSHELRYDFHTTSAKSKKSYYMLLGMDWLATQRRIDTDFETITRGYINLKAGTGLSIEIGRNVLEVFIHAENLTNSIYYNHLSRYKQIGVNGMARNITFGLQLPLTFTLH
jgi:iron complex outermembrane receptor protein